jgi:hypothetical protein
MKHTDIISGSSDRMSSLNKVPHKVPAIWHNQINSQIQDHEKHNHRHVMTSNAKSPRLRLQNVVTPPIINQQNNDYANSIMQKRGNSTDQGFSSAYPSTRRKHLPDLAKSSDKRAKKKFSHN